MNWHIFGSNVIVLIIALAIGYFIGKKNPTVFGLIKAA